MQSLLIIDMLNDFVRADGALTAGPPAQAVVPVVRAELEAAREKGRAVFFVCDRHRDNDPEFDTWPVHCLVGTPGASIVPELEPQSGRDEVIIPKRRYSGFFGTDLDLHLRERGVNHLRITGLLTNICVLYTAASARMRGYQVTVPAHAVAALTQEHHQAALDQLEVIGCQVERD